MLEDVEVQVRLQLAQPLENRRVKQVQRIARFAEQDGRSERQDPAQYTAAAGERIYSNAQMGPRQIRTYCELSSDCERLLERAMQQQGLSARAHDRILKVARTIADLDGTTEIQSKHIAEAIQYRTLDRSYWA